ncbi:MAG: GGDEF domain-containing protein, partial [Ruminococcus sp.]|nr:GGDEF domain-containing protein [Ruminococcus sp.]
AADKMISSNSKASEYIVCYADMDNLKLINDGYGHIEGDYSLKLAAECMRSVFGKKAVIGRLGGDEYAAVLPSSSKKPEGYLVKKDKIISEINASQQKPYRFGLSMGILKCRCDNGYDLKAALDKADDLLYVQKQKIKSNK